MAPMTAEELLKHPEYEHTIWDLEPTQKAKLPVAAGRGGPLNIAYEVHGRGKIHLVVRRLFYTYLHTYMTLPPASTPTQISSSQIGSSYTYDLSPFHKTRK